MLTASSCISSSVDLVWAKERLYDAVTFWFCRIFHKTTTTITTARITTIIPTATAFTEKQVYMYTTGAEIQVYMCTTGAEKQVYMCASGAEKQGYICTILLEQKEMIQQTQIDY